VFLLNILSTFVFSNPDLLFKTINKSSVIQLSCLRCTLKHNNVAVMPLVGVQAIRAFQNRCVINISIDSLYLWQITTVSHSMIIKVLKTSRIGIGADGKAQTFFCTVLTIH
jgi:hypothetical protein